MTESPNPTLSANFQRSHDPYAAAAADGLQQTMNADTTNTDTTVAEGVVRIWTSTTNLMRAAGSRYAQHAVLPLEDATPDSQPIRDVVADHRTARGQ